MLLFWNTADRTRAYMALLLLILAPGIRAETPLKGLSLEQLGNIEVTTASRQPVKVTRTPAAIYVITQDDIRRSGATSIPEVLRLAPGVEVARIDSVKWSVGIRGFGSRLSRSVLVIIDGRTVYSPLSAGVYWEVQDTLLEDVERIEIIRGPGATIWGANAVNGVINIITRSAKDTAGTLASTGGGPGQRYLNLRYGGGNGKNLNYRAYAKTFARGPEFHSDHKEFDTWHMGQGGFRMDWDREGAGRDLVTVQGDFYSGLIGESLSVAAESTSRAEIVQQDGRLAGGNLLGRWRRVLKNGSDFQVQTYFDRTTRQEANLAEMRNTFDIDFLHHVSFWRRHELLWGAGIRLSAGRMPQVVPTIRFTPDQRTDKLYSSFIQDEIQILENRLSVTLGSKVIHTDFSGFSAEPSARVLWTPGNHQTVWAAVTRAVRTPTDIERTFEVSALWSTAPLAILRLTPNGVFRPETLLGYEAGYRRLLHPNLHLDVTVFDNRYDSLVSSERSPAFREPTPAPPRIVIPFSIGNGLYGATSGFELAPDWKPGERWRLSGSYSYLHMDLKTRPNSMDLSTAKSAQGASPHHQVLVQSSLDLPGNLEFSQTYRYVSGLPTYLVSGYGTVDVRLSWRGVKPFEFSVVGQNLLQPHHAEAGGDPGTLVGIRRTVYAGIVWRR